MYIARQIGHEDVSFTLKVYASAVKRRERLSGAHRKAFEEAIEWAQMGTNDVFVPEGEKVEGTLWQQETRRFQRVYGVGGTGLEPVTPSLSSWCSPN